MSERDGIRVLVVDDEASVRFALTEILEDAGYAVVAAESAEHALAQVREVDIVISDLVMPGMSGLELLREIKAGENACPVILVTARGSEKAAVEALKSGAYDYLTKPFAVDDIRASVRRAAELHGRRRAERHLAAERALGRPIVAEAPAMRRLFELVSRLAPRDVTVLVRGQTGTGKEVVAGLLHAWSRRRDGPYVVFNCAAIPRELAESELFGHVRGAFTGAREPHRGFFQRAHGGTLVLDEVGELPLDIQAKLLRALQSGEVQPVGAGRVEQVDVRVVSCSNRDLAQEAQAGRFRMDLYYRLAVVELLVPPLSERRSDIPALALALAQRHARRFGMAPVRLSPALLTALERRPWPGNVRELDNAIARLVALAEEGELIELTALEGAGPSADTPGSRPEAALGLRAQLEAYERELIASALVACDGNQSATARMLRISRSTLIDKLKRLGLEAPTSRADSS